MIQAFEVAPAGSDPAGALLAPLTTGADGKTALHLDGLPDGHDLGELAVADAPQGCRNVAAHIADGWSWRLRDGEGWVCREGKGPVRSNGTRPKLRILEPCRSVSLRACAVDPEFEVVTHYVVIVWVQLTRTKRWTCEYAHAWSTEPAPTGGRWASRLGITLGRDPCGALLAEAPSAYALDEAIARRLAKINSLEHDNAVSGEATGDE